MCEIFGLTSKKVYAANDLLDSFFEHGKNCPDGWGLAVFRGAGVSMEKEPACTLKSSYLKNRMTRKIEANNLFAHIRNATLGRIEYANCHPFVWDDSSGRTWTLVHNGTFFKAKDIAPFIDQQEGSTDSERLLLYLIERVNEFTEKHGYPSEEERFRIVDNAVTKLSDGNKLNVLIYDGTVMYVHTNCPDTLHVLQDEEKCVFATVPVLYGGWKKAAMNQLVAYKDGIPVREGTRHSHVFYDEEHDYTPLFAAFSEL